MKVKRIPAGVYAANCYLIIDEESKELGLIDPGGDFEELNSAIEQTGAELKCIFITHGHADHTGALEEFSKKYNCNIYLNAKDERIMRDKGYLFGDISVDMKIVNVVQNDIIKLGNYEIVVLDTPGHTPGGVCYYVEGLVFSGDTLFRSSIGRSDLPGGDFDLLVHSIRNVLYNLPDDTIVYPGHAFQSTIGYEKSNNPFVRV